MVKAESVKIICIHPVYEFVWNLWWCYLFMCMCALWLCLCCGQSPPRKSEDELREEEELQLALALSKSEAEHKEKEVIVFMLLIPVILSFHWTGPFLRYFHYLQLIRNPCMICRCVTMESIIGKLSILKFTICLHLWIAQLLLK